jgi:hypothetical protein
MKALKITLMLAVFALTFSGTSNNTEMTPTNDTIQKIDKNEFKYISDVSKKTNKPNQRA